MTRSLIFGSNGYIGRHLSHEIEKYSNDYYCFDIQEKSVDQKANYRQFDVTHSSEFAKLPSDVDYIFWFSGLTGTSNGFDHYSDFIEVNEVGLFNLLDWMRKADCKARIIFPSTRLIYKGKDEALNEDAEKEAKTIYALNKLSAEYSLQMYAHVFGIKYTVFRICVPYGNMFGQDYSYGTIGFFLSNAKQNKPIPLFGDGSLKRTFTHVEDICEVILQSIQYPETLNQIFNIGGENFSLSEVASQFASLYNVPVANLDWPELALKIESGHTVFDSSKLHSIIRYEYKHQLINEIRKLTQHK